MLVTLDLDRSVTMPPRRILQRNEIGNEKREEEREPPPPPDTVTRMLEGMLSWSEHRVLRRLR